MHHIQKKQKGLKNNLKTQNALKHDCCALWWQKASFKVKTTAHKQKSETAVVSEATWFQGCCCARRPARPPCAVHGTSDTACTWDIRNRRQRLITTYPELKKNKTHWRPRKRVSTAGEHGDHVTGGAQVHMSVRIIIMCCHTSNMSHCECVISRILITTFLLSLDKKSCFI